MSTTTERITSTDALTFAEALVRFAHVIDHLYVDASRAQGLTPQQANLLCLLIDEPVGMTDISELLHLGRSSLTGLVDRVERRGLVERIPDDRDGRACRIALTGDGLQRALASHANVAQRVEAMVDGMAETDREQVASAITQLLIRHRPAARSNGNRSADQR